MTDPDLAYDGLRTTRRRPCTCAGTAPGYPQHEIGCGDEPDDITDTDDQAMRAWQDSHDAPPEED